MNTEKDLLKAVFETKQSCLDLKELERYLDEETDPKGRARMGTHLRHCAHCATELALLSEFQSGSPGGDEVEAVNWITRRLQERQSEIVGHSRLSGGTTERKWARRWNVLRSSLFPRHSLLPASAVAALLLMVVGGALYFRNAPPDLPAAVKATSPLLRSGIIEGMMPVGELQQRPLRLQWDQVSAASVYAVELFEVDRTLLWSGQSSSNRIDLPEEVVNKILVGKRLQWRVRALDVQGRMIAVSETASFRVSNSEEGAS
ncbi:MAG: hypothetical protein ACE5JX_01025 [Acidobacteriota bacterium]